MENNVWEQPCKIQPLHTDRNCKCTLAAISQIFQDTAEEHTLNAGYDYFSLMKGETKRVTFDKKPEEVNVICANNIEFEHNPMRKKMFRMLYRSKFVNVARAIGYAIN